VKTIVLIPTYNERDNLPDTARRLRTANPTVDLLVIDDASPDGTGKIADELAEEDDHIHVLHREGKSGLGSAYVAGFSWALRHGYPVIVEMDADGSHQPEELPRLLAALEHADLVIGSRWVPGGQVRNWPWIRLLLSRGGNAYVRAALGIPLHDATAGFRAYRAEVLRDRDLDLVASQGYCFQVDLAWRAWQAGFRVVEVPIDFVEREHGASKMSRTIVAEGLWRVGWWAVTSLRRGPRGTHPTALNADIEADIEAAGGEAASTEPAAPTAGGEQAGTGEPATPGAAEPITAAADPAGDTASADAPGTPGVTGSPGVPVDAVPRPAGEPADPGTDPRGSRTTV
jgi:apolipoprotein N-acyltransferase